MDTLLIAPGGARVLREPPEQLPAEGFLVCDCPADEPRAWVEPMRRLTGVTVFDNHVLDAENGAHPSYFESTRQYEMIIFRGLTVQSSTDARETPEIFRLTTQPTVFFVTPRLLVVVRPPDAKHLPAIRERLQMATSSGQRLPGSPEELMLRILNGMVDRFLELRLPLSEQLERWQRLLLNPRKPFRDWMLLLEARDEARRLEQLCEEQLDALQEWRDERVEHEDTTDTTDTTDAPALPPLSDALQVRANDLVQHIQRVLSLARRLETSVETTVQLHFSATAFRTNEIMRTLTTLSAIFMPLTLITGIFGMNFEAIPGLHSQFGFWITLGVMAFIALTLMGVFRAKRYLSRSDFHLAAIERRRRGRALRHGRGAD